MSSVTTLMLHSLKAMVLFTLVLFTAIPYYNALAETQGRLSVETSSLLSSLPYNAWMLSSSSSSSSPSTTLAGSMDIQITFDPQFLPQNEPSITINPADKLNLVAGANDYRLARTTGGAWAGYYTSRDGGKSWTNNLIPGFPGDSTTTVLSNFRFSADPALAFDSQGNAYYSGIAFNVKGNNPADGSVFLAKSTDGGMTFSQTVLVAAGSGTRLFHDKSYLAADRSNSIFKGTVYVSWTRFTTTTATIMTSYSRNGGLTFSPPLQISVSGANQGSMPAVGANGEVYVAWLDFISSTIRLAKSQDGGTSFTVRNVQPVVRIPNPLPNSLFRTNSFPSLAVDDTTGNVYVVWADNRNGNADILFTISTDGGSTWSSPTRVNDDTTANDQFFPWITTSGGTISTVFYDRRDDPGNHNIHVYYAKSMDSGQSFRPNTRVSDVQIDPDIDFQGEFIGDYIGVASDGATAYPVWTDTRNGNQDIFTEALQIAAVHDISVTNVVPERDFAYTNVKASLAVTVDVENLGTDPETFSVTLSAGALTIGSATVSGLTPGSTSSVTFSWDTQTAPKGNHTLSATASTVQGETETTNNSLTDGVLEIRFPGDVNSDGRVDVVDLAMVGLAFTSTPTSSSWNPNADINNDKIVNVVDLGIVGMNFGSVDP